MRDAAEREAIPEGLARQLKKGDKAPVGNAGYRRDKTIRGHVFSIFLVLVLKKARLALPRIFRTSGLLWRILQPRLGVAGHSPRSTGASPAYFSSSSPRG